MDNRADLKRPDIELPEQGAGFSSELHQEYQRLFEDLEPTEFGRFGIGRMDLETRPTTVAHSRDHIPSQTAQLAFFLSRRGKPLGDGALDILFVRGELRQGATLTGPIPPAWAEVKNWAAQVGQELTDKGEAHATATFQDRDVEARLVRLSKKECLSCHFNMKIGDPVAVMIYDQGRKAGAKAKG